MVAQRETTPPGDVSVEGVVTSIGEQSTPEFLERLYGRYLDAAEAKRRVAARGETEIESVILRVRPERWRTTDYSKA